MTGIRHLPVSLNAGREHVEVACLSRSLDVGPVAPDPESATQRQQALQVGRKPHRAAIPKSSASGSLNQDFTGISPSARQVETSGQEPAPQNAAKRGAAREVMERGEWGRNAEPARRFRAPGSVGDSPRTSERIRERQSELENAWPSSRMIASAARTPWYCASSNREMPLMSEWAKRTGPYGAAARRRASPHTKPGTGRIIA